MKSPTDCSRSGALEAGSGCSTSTRRTWITSDPKCLDGLVLISHLPSVAVMELRSLPLQILARFRKEGSLCGPIRPSSPTCPTSALIAGLTRGA
jgi:hypothetical protein